MKILDKIILRLRSDDYSTMDVYIDVFDTPLGRKWLTALNDILNQNLILEKKVDKGTSQLLNGGSCS